MALTVVVRQLYPHTAVSKVCSWLVPASTLFNTSAGVDREAFNWLTQETYFEMNDAVTQVCCLLPCLRLTKEVHAAGIA